MLNGSEICGPQLVDALLGPMPIGDHLQQAADVLAEMHAATSSSYEVSVQRLLVSLFQRLRERHEGNSAMLVWDTHLHGLAISSSSNRAKPDLLLCEGFQQAASVVTAVEAKPNLSASSYTKEVAFQLEQRVEQLQSHQPSRSKWVLAAVGAEAVEIWHFQKVFEHS